MTSTLSILSLEAQKLKKEFDEMLGFNVYKLFPDVLEN